MKLQRRSRGVTLVELLVSISMGLVVAGAMAALYLASSRSYRQSEALGQLQSNARYVFEIMGYDIRMAGNMSCYVPGQSAPANFVDSYSDSSRWWSNTDRPLFGIEESADGNAEGDAGFPADYGDKALRGDSVIVLRAETDDNTGIVENYDRGQAPISFRDGSGKGFKDSSLLLISNCNSQAAVFQKTSSGGKNTDPIPHKLRADSGTSPGNCKSDLTGTANTPAGSCPPGGSTLDMSGAKLLALSANAYYLRNSPRRYASSRHFIPSLFRQTLGTDGDLASTRAEELVSGVTDLQVRYGVDDDGNGVLDRYVTANDVADWGRVLAARVTITLETAEDAVATASSSFTLGNGSVITDRRLRRSYTATFSLRERLS